LLSAKQHLLVLPHKSHSFTSGVRDRGKCFAFPAMHTTIPWLQRQRLHDCLQCEKGGARLAIATAKPAYRYACCPTFGWKQDFQLQCNKLQCMVPLFNYTTITSRLVAQQPEGSHKQRHISKQISSSQYVRRVSIHRQNSNECQSSAQTC